MIPKSFDLDRHFRNAWFMISSSGPDSPVIVRFKSLVARNVAEVKWHEIQQTRFLPDESLEFLAKVSGLDEISWWILGYGDQAEVLQPAKLRRIVAQRVKNMAKIYNGSC